jgi:hypothetical protein
MKEKYCPYWTLIWIRTQALKKPIYCENHSKKIFLRRGSSKLSFASFTQEGSSIMGRSSNVSMALVEKNFLHQSLSTCLWNRISVFYMSINHDKNNSESFRVGIGIEKLDSTVHYCRNSHPCYHLQTEKKNPSKINNIIVSWKENECFLSTFSNAFVYHSFKVNIKKNSFNFVYKRWISYAVRSFIRFNETNH